MVKKAILVISLTSIYLIFLLNLKGNIKKTKRFNLEIRESQVDFSIIPNRRKGASSR